MTAEGCRPRRGSRRNDRDLLLPGWYSYPFRPYSNRQIHTLHSVRLDPTSPLAVHAAIVRGIDPILTRADHVAPDRRNNKTMRGPRTRW